MLQFSDNKNELCLLSIKLEPILVIQFMTDERHFCRFGIADLVFLVFDIHVYVILVKIVSAEYLKKYST